MTIIILSDIIAHLLYFGQNTLLPVDFLNLKMKDEIANAFEAIDSDLLIVYGGVFKSYKKDERIFQEGDHPQYYHQIISGRVKMMSETEDGKEFIQGFFTDGQSFGEPLIFEGDENPASAIADHASVIIRLCIFSFIQLLKENFDVHFNLTKRLSHRLKNGSNALTEISCNTPENRIVSILNHYKSDKSYTSDTSKIKVDYTRQQIAEMTGLRVETVIRVMRNLNDRNILDIKKGKVFY